MSNDVKAGLDAANEATKEAPEVYSTMGALDIFKDERESPPIIWGGLTLTPGEIMEVIGPAGLGKSRLLLNFAINQILGRSFADLPTYKPPKDKEPLKWLFYGNENSFFRFRNDLKGMFSILSDEERERVGEHLFLPTMEKPEDCFITFLDKANLKKFYATIVQRKASVVVMDPWGAIIAGDELNDGNVRQTILDITKTLHEATAKLGHPVVGIILNHSRNGIREIVNACGPNAANYGKNSKAIFSVVRIVWNLRPGEIAEKCNKIELIHAKGNDIQKYDYICVELNPNTMCYNVDTTFNHDVHQAMLEALERSGSAMTSEEKKTAAEKTDAENKKKICRHITGVGSEIRKLLEVYTTSIGIAKNKASGYLTDLVKEGKVVVLIDPSNNRTVCTNEKSLELLKNAEPGFYRVWVPHDTPREVPPELPESTSCTQGSSDGE